MLKLFTFMVVAVGSLCLQPRGGDNQEGNPQLCTGMESTLESCIRGKPSKILDDNKLHTWLRARHGADLSVAGIEILEMCVEDIVEVLGLSSETTKSMLGNWVAKREFAREKPKEKPPLESETESSMKAGFPLRTIYHGREGQVPNLQQRLAIFERIVCEKCARRGVDCKCESMDDSPLLVFREYAALHEHWHNQIAENGKYADDVEYVVVKVAEAEGVGNQMLKMITGLIFAMHMRRALVVQPLTPQSSSSVDPVINYLTEYPGQADFALQLDNPNTLSAFMCGDVSEEWKERRVLVLENAMQAPHIFLQNPHFGSGLRERLLDLPVFFLSHFLWSGAEHHAAVVFSIPTPMPWDGLTSFDALADGLATAGARVVGFHVRTGAAQVTTQSSSAVRYIQLDHAQALREWNASGQDRAVDFCNGHPASMEPMYECFLEVLGELRAESPGAKVAVLWATDQGPITAEMQGRIAALDNVWIVQIAHDAEAGHGQHDVVRQRDSGLFDMQLLGLSEFLLGGTGSTFSFLAHARALAMPKYSAFLKPGGPKCAAAGGSEAGLITAGRAYDRCSSVGGFDVACEAVTPACVGVLIQLWKYERCLQVHAWCWNDNIEWLKPYVVDVEYTRYFQSFLMRMRGVLRTPPDTEPVYYPSCFPDPHWPQ